MVLGWGNYSNAVTCSTLSADPRAPRRLRRATDALAHDAFDLTWDPPASGAAAEATGGYSVKVREVTEAAVTGWRVVSTHKFASQDRVSRVTGLMPGRSEPTPSHHAFGLFLTQKVSYSEKREGHPQRVNFGALRVSPRHLTGRTKRLLSLSTQRSQHMPPLPRSSAQQTTQLSGSTPTECRRTSSPRWISWPTTTQERSRATWGL